MSEPETPPPSASQQSAPKQPDAPKQASHVVHAKEAPARAESKPDGEDKKDGNGMMWVLGIAILGVALYLSIKFYKERKEKNEQRTE